MMFFGLFQTSPTDKDDDIATGTYADGMAGTRLSDVCVRPDERSGQNFRRIAHERDYGASRAGGQGGLGKVR